ncbi:ABC transporter ATP-binding protein [Halobellus ruber]|uniref:ABC transporter ATP-binding protein n=1 Tax=Halobellus ruber TaxID=2761102 RepID=A0A7J9SF43_9EURY|nr:ABC transporter ATP-binding protein [Halobellus ruber]MBB6645585.1 ABC transporter ATP-binding protein [Halobellus ruber]
MTDRGGPILRTTGLTKRFGEFTAVDGVDLAVDRGEFRSIIGPNGAGKTTLFNLISGAMTPTEGTITLSGRDITALSPAERVAANLARSFQLTTVFNGLSVRENVRLAAQAERFETLSTARRLFADSGELEGVDRRTDAVLDELGLRSVADARASDLSYGDRRRLEVGLVLATDPDVVLLDEPTAGMSGDETDATIELFEDVLADRTVLLVEHNVDLVMRVSDRITTLNGGREVATGTPAEIAADDRVREAYLGGYTA